MKPKPSPRDLNQQEYRNFITTGALVALIVLLALLFNLDLGEFPDDVRQRLVPLILGATLYGAVYSIYLAAMRRGHNLIMWINAIICGGGLLLFAIILPAEINGYYRLLALLVIISVSVLSDRLPILFVLVVGILVPAAHWLTQAESFRDAAGYLGVPLMAVVVSETLIRIQNVTNQQIHRLDTINAFSRQIASTLDRSEILSLLNAAIPKAVTADSFYVGIQEGDEILVPLFYDDGQYFNNIRVKLEGSLSGWVVQNRCELFLPDLRDPLDLPGVSVVVAGQEKISLCWMGAPMVTNHFKGLIALASYKPNAFNRGDMELLANLSQHVSLALENALIHEDVERRSRLDQMTGVLNHGAFLESLQGMADESQLQGTTLSLIMLDVDHFKRYNDTYGHLVGDKVLNLLCDTVRAHIKNTDAVGRWGGEEFIIALPGASGRQAYHVSERIRKTMNKMQIPGRVGEPIPAPTVSQGIAEFPAERSTIFDLIDLADQRLYIAKGRGRNQIEPGELSWTVSD